MSDCYGLFVLGFNFLSYVLLAFLQILRFLQWACIDISICNTEDF